MADSDLLTLTISELAPRIKAKEISPVELTEAALAQADRLQPKLNSFITLLHDQARAQAKEQEAALMRGEYRGPLHGIPIGIKDNIATAHIKTTVGSKVLADQVPAEDALVVTRMKEAGAIILGKENLEEFAAGPTSNNLHYGAVHNPWNLDHITGGSSSGSGSAVASGQAMAALGSCTGGSIRGPASLCGIVGLKATYGRVSRAGVVTLSWSQDHCGPMTWTVEDSAYMLQAIAGHDPKDTTSSKAPVPDYSLSLREDIQGKVIGLPRHYFFDADPSVNAEVVAVVEKAVSELESLGAKIETVELPSLEYVRAANTIIMVSEAFAFHEPNLRTRPQDFGEIVRARFRIGGMLSAGDYLQAQRCRQWSKREFAAALRKVDFFVTPTMTQPAPAFEGYDPNDTIRGRSFTAPFNVTGLPAISVPCGFTQAGLPVGMQIAGKAFDEPGVIQAAYTYQQHARWYEQRPNI